MILSSIPSIRVWPFFTSSGSKLLSRSRGTATGISPSCPFSTLVEVPFRRLEPLAHRGVLVDADIDQDTRDDHSMNMECGLIPI